MGQDAQASPDGCGILQPGERRRRMSGRKESHHMITIVAGLRTAPGPPLRHDDHDRRRAKPAPDRAVAPDGRTAAEPGQQA
jgi:hypothetical protein